MSLLSIPGVPDDFLNGSGAHTGSGRRWLLYVTIGSAVILLALVTGIEVFLRPVPILAEAPRLDPIVDTVVFLISLSVAVLALGRYPVLRTPVSYWIGLGFLGYALVTIIRYILFAPTLLGNTPVQQISADLINVFLWYSLFSISIPTTFLLAGVVLPWPSGRALEGRQLVGSALILLLASVLALLAMMAFPHVVPVLYDPQRDYISPLLSFFNMGLIPLFWVGALLSMRRYLQTGDDLVGYVGLVQVIFGIQMITALLSHQQYDVWWYMQRGLTIGGFLSLMFGLLAEYMHGFKRERESDARYRQLTESLPQLIWTSTPDGRCDYLSPQWLEYTGQPLANQLGYGWLELVLEQDRQRVLDAWRATVRTGSEFNVEFRLRRYDGVYCWFKTMAVPICDVTGSIVRWFGSNTDIDDQKRYQIAVIESEERFRQLADAMPQLVWTALPDGVNDYYNQRYQEYSGIFPGQDNEWHSASALHPDDHDWVTDLWKESLRTGNPFQLECRIKMANGEFRWHLVRAVLMHDETGKPVKWFGTSTDIHDLKEAKNAVDGYAVELERSNRDLQDFAFVASHDLQEPLRKIEAFGDAVLDQSANLTERQREYLVRMRKAANRMRHMVDGLLQLSRLSTNARQFEPVSLRQAVDDALMDLEVQIQQSEAQIEVGELPLVIGDPLQMRRLLQNLIGNALKFQPAGARPYVRVYSQPAEPGRVEICVQDNGVGFNDAYAEQAFQPFKRLVGRAEFEGSGIGLAICRKIAERHGGAITARSQEGQGATFIVNLPDRSNDRYGESSPNETIYLTDKKPTHGDKTFIFDR